MLKDLKTKDIQELVTLKFTSGRIRQAGGLSARTVKYIYQTIHSALEQAVKERVLLLNPAKHVELPKQEKKEMRPFTKEELSVFFEACEENRHFIIFFLAVATGMRRGEVFGLTWDNVNFETGTIEIKKQLIRSKDHGFVLKDLKTKKSKRALKVTADVLDRLKNYKKEGLSSEKMKQKMLPTIRFHDLRHTYATLSLEAGVDLATISKNMGHSSYAITADTYSHMTNTIKAEAAEKICSLVTECLEKK